MRLCCYGFGALRFRTEGGEIGCSFEGTVKAELDSLVVLHRFVQKPLKCNGR